ncbi:MAG: VanZ family protein [Gordonibacter sp.]|nr:VanZ family protein [Gordonibacter sp.]
MEEFLMVAYELATILAPFLVAYGGVRAWGRRSGKPTARFAMALTFALYLFAVIYVTGIGTLHDLLRLGFEIRTQEVNLIPFSGGISSGFALNIALFVPLGFLLPFLWRRVRSALPVVAFGFAFSLLIELSQLANHRTTDADDLVANTLGTLVGFVIFALYLHFSHGTSTSRSQITYGLHATYTPVFAKHPRGGWTALGEPAIYLATMLVGHFLLFNEYGFACMLYSF